MGRVVLRKPEGSVGTNGDGGHLGDFADDLRRVTMEAKEPRQETSVKRGRKWTGFGVNRGVQSCRKCSSTVLLTYPITDVCQTPCDQPESYKSTPKKKYLKEHSSCALLGTLAQATSTQIISLYFASSLTTSCWVQSTLSSHRSWGGKVLTVHRYT